MPRIVDRSQLSTLLSALRSSLLPRLTGMGRRACAATGVTVLAACASEPPPGPPPPPMGGAAT
ncbi:hypothetical protein ABTK13_22490, partial [Acinetobacter baumannii]